MLEADENIMENHEKLPNFLSEDAMTFEREEKIANDFEDNYKHVALDYESPFHISTEDFKVLLTRFAPSIKRASKRS